MTTRYTSLLVEGLIDEVIIRKVVEEIPGITVSQCYGKKGRSYIESKIEAFSKGTTQFNPIICLVDMDRADCPLEVIKNLLPDYGNEYVIVRVAVTEVEAWLLADRENFARFIGAPISKIALLPESYADPKHEIIQLARRYGNAEMKRDLVPDDDHVKVGKGYTSQIIRFVREFWNIQEAKTCAPSLARAIAAIERIAK